MRSLIRAYNSQLLSPPFGTDDVALWPLPSSVEWMPEGEHKINAWVNDEPGTLTVICAPEDAARLDAQLQQLIKLASEGKASRPFIDFDHDEGQAAAIPVRFFWANGIRLEVEWTNAGSEALRGRTYSYFSPTWLQKEDGHPQAIPDVGPIGALVNTPAFQSIERLAAKNGGSKETNTISNRMKKLLNVLVEAGIIASADTTEDIAIQQVKASLDKIASDRASELSTVKAALDSEKAEHAKTSGEVVAIKREFAEHAVSAAVASGRIEDKPESRASLIEAHISNRGAFNAILGSVRAGVVNAGHPNTDLPGNKKVDDNPVTGLKRTEAAIRAALKFN